VINCIGVIKQSYEMHSVANCIHMNALFPHQLWDICKQYGVRLIHISTDCVFDGARGGYTESDQSNAVDIYGQSKALGEISEKGALTLRTSIIGHELETNLSLLNWFLSQRESVKGYQKAIFSGLTTVEMANLLNSVVLKMPSLSGLYHVSSEPIDKFSLLMLIKTQYHLPLEIDPDLGFVIDRSLNSDKFRQATGYIPPKWPDMISQMRDFNQKYG
jgi:dTDP-4-dehydrorhamnose reductase